MAIRFDSSSEALTRTASLLDYNSPYAITWWFHFTVNTGGYGQMMSLSGGTGDYDGLYINGAQLEMYVSHSSSETGAVGSSLVVGNWYHLAIVREGFTSLKVYLNGALDITNLDNVTTRVAVAQNDIDQRSGVTGEAFNGRVCAVKAWSTSLTLAEVNSEMNTIRPINQASLHAFWPMFPGSGERIKDYSGNGRDWTEVGTLTDEDPAPVSYGGSSILVSAAAGGGGGSPAPTIPNFRVPINPVIMGF